MNKIEEQILMNQNMNNDKLILESLGWLLATQNGHSSFSDKERIRLIREIDDVVNPPKQPTIAERTHDAFSQSNAEGVKNE